MKSNRNLSAPDISYNDVMMQDLPGDSLQIKEDENESALEEQLAGLFSDSTLELQLAGLFSDTASPETADTAPQPAVPLAAPLSIGATRTSGKRKRIRAHWPARPNWSTASLSAVAACLIFALFFVEQKSFAQPASTATPFANRAEAARLVIQPAKTPAMPAAVQETPVTTNQILPDARAQVQSSPTSPAPPPRATLGEPERSPTHAPTLTPTSTTETRPTKTLVPDPTNTLAPSPTATATSSADPTTTPTRNASPTATATGIINPSPTSAPTSPPPPPALIDSQPTRLFIPAIDLDAPIITVGYENLAIAGQAVSTWAVPSYFASGWHHTSAPPGQNGNTVLNGHQHIHGGVFKDLSILQVGDEIVVYSGSISFHYRVSERHLLAEEGQPLSVRVQNARWIMPTADQRLTLVTCAPDTQSTHRLIIVATPASPANSG